jgi:Domain of unknown function (DUF4839)
LHGQAGLEDDHARNRVVGGDEHRRDDQLPPRRERAEVHERCLEIERGAERAVVSLVECTCTVGVGERTADSVERVGTRSSTRAAAYGSSSDSRPQLALEDQVGGADVDPGRFRTPRSVAPASARPSVAVGVLGTASEIRSAVPVDNHQMSTKAGNSTMRSRCLVVALAICLGFAGCGSDSNPVMPDVTGKKLDVAKSAIKDAGFEDEVKVDGGGVFGVIDESNWQVCDQSPVVGADLSDAPRLTVDRSCDNAEPSETSTSIETPSETPAPDTDASREPDAEQVLTADNSEEFAALLAVPDYCDETIAPFVAKYGGRTIEFDGSVANLANHGDYDTRYDILVAPGNKGPESTEGPAFRFEDVNVADLNLTGAGIPDSVGAGDRFRFVARVVEYNPNQCLLFLAPVSSRVR